MVSIRRLNSSRVIPSVWQNSKVSIRPLASFITTMMSYAGWLKTSNFPFRSKILPREGYSIFFRKAFESALFL